MTEAVAQSGAKERHPKGLYVLFFTEMWERFGFYTMLAIFTLYLDEYFHFATPGAIYGGYLAAVYFTPIAGGWSQTGSSGSAGPSWWAPCSWPWATASSRSRCPRARRSEQQVVAAEQAFQQARDRMAGPLRRRQGPGPEVRGSPPRATTARAAHAGRALFFVGAPRHHPGQRPLQAQHLGHGGQPLPRGQRAQGLGLQHLLHGDQHRGLLRPHRRGRAEEHPGLELGLRRGGRRACCVSLGIFHGLQAPRRTRRDQADRGFGGPGRRADQIAGVEPHPGPAGHLRHRHPLLDVLPPERLHHDALGAGLRRGPSSGGGRSRRRSSRRPTPSSW